MNAVAPQIIRHEIREGARVPWQVIPPVLFGGLLVGAILGGLTIRSCYDPPEVLEATQAAYEERIVELEKAGKEAQEAASEAAQEAYEHRLKATGLEDQLRRYREQVTDRRREAVEEVKREISELPEGASTYEVAKVANLGFRQMSLFAESLEHELDLQTVRAAQSEAAIADLQYAYSEERAAREYAEKRAETAEARVEEWRGTNRRRIATAGAIALAVAVVLLAS